MAINNQPTIKPITVTGIFTRYIAKTIPLAFDESMSYYECLCALLDYLNEKVMPDLNNVNSGLEELQNFYVELQDYVNHYFDNLDVEQEINDKLDRMVETGQFDTIVQHYLNPYLVSFNNRLNAQDQLINSVVNNNPTPVASTSDMTDTSKIYVLTTDGNWYYYNGEEWVVGGVYQSTVGNENFFVNGVNLIEDISATDSYKGLTIKYEKGVLSINGTMPPGNGPLYLRLSSSYKHGGTAGTIAYTGSLDYLVVGHTYQLITNVISGSVTYTGNNPGVSLRSSTNSMLLRIGQGVGTLTENVNRLQFYAPDGTVFNNYILNIALYEINTNVNLTENIGYYQLGNTEIPGLTKLYENLSYKTFKSFNNINLYKEYMNNTEETQTQTLITQGMCSDRQRYIWFTVFDREDTTTIDDKLCYLKKYDIVNDEIVASSTAQTAHILGHANGMCYKDGYLYIASLDSSNTVYKVNANTLEYVESFIVPMDNIPKHFADIDYNPDLDRYICLISPYDDYHRAIAFYTPNWELEKIIKLDKNGSVPYEVTSTNSTAGGIFTDREFIYMTLVNVFDGTQTQYNWNAYIYLYDYEGNYVDRIAINYEHEAECITKIDSNVYVNYNNTKHDYVLIEKLVPVTYNTVLKSDVRSQYNMN